MTDGAPECVPDPGKNIHPGLTGKGKFMHKIVPRKESNIVPFYILLPREVQDGPVADRDGWHICHKIDGTCFYLEDNVKLEDIHQKCITPDKPDVHDTAFWIDVVPVKTWREHES